MRVYTCTDHDAHWPVGCASIVVARDEAEARELLNEALLASRLTVTNYTLVEVDLTKPEAVVLLDGDY